MQEYTKEFYQRSWGAKGYYERFSYGVGIETVCQKCLYPFLSQDKIAVEIGPGGGVFTERMIGEFKHLTALDVIKRPAQLTDRNDFTYIELPDKSSDCPGIRSASVDFVFSYNVFCHLSNKFLIKYIVSINKILKSGGDFVFMLSNFHNVKQYFIDKAENYQFGDMLPNGHFYQDNRTIDIIAGDGWEIINRSMIPEHRDIIVHLKKKENV